MLNFKIPKGLHIRPSTASDNAFLEELHRTQRQELQLIDAEQDFIDSLVEMQFRAKTSGYGSQTPNAMYFIIEKHHEKIGKATLDFNSESIHLVDIAFLPQARGLGFGKAIIQSFQQAASQNKAPITLNVSDFNMHAQNLYLSLGFRVESYQPPNYRMVWYPSNENVQLY